MHDITPSVIMLNVTMFGIVMHSAIIPSDTWGYIFSRVWPFYERAVSNLGRSMHGSLWV